MITLRDASIDVLEKLVDQNTDKASSDVCTDVECVGVSCSKCPMSSRDGVKATLGDVRMELYKRKAEPTESHKGGGGWSRQADVFITGKSEGVKFIPTCSDTKADEVDMVNNPPHYTSGEIECIDAIRVSMSEEAFKGFLKGNVLKYIWRYEKKINPLEDLKKASWYLTRLRNLYQ